MNLSSAFSKSVSLSTFPQRFVSYLNFPTFLIPRFVSFHSFTNHFSSPSQNTFSLTVYFSYPQHRPTQKESLTRQTTRREGKQEIQIKQEKTSKDIYRLRRKKIARRVNKEIVSRNLDWRSTSAWRGFSYKYFTFSEKEMSRRVLETKEIKIYRSI